MSVDNPVNKKTFSIIRTNILFLAVFWVLINSFKSPVGCGWIIGWAGGLVFTPHRHTDVPQIINRCKLTVW